MGLDYRKQEVQFPTDKFISKSKKKKFWRRMKKEEGRGITWMLQ